MSIREFTKSGAFVVTILALVVVLVPFGIEEIGESTDWFRFPVKKTISGWFAFGKPAPPRDRTASAVDWERYRLDLAEFTTWVEGMNDVAISVPDFEEAEIEVEEEETPERRMWFVPVASCTSGDAVGGGRGYVFISGFDRPFKEGAVIAPSETLCGYEIVFVGERSVWLRAVFEDEGDVPMGVVKFPEFTRMEGESLVKGNRKYVARDAFRLKSGGWLMIDSFMPPNGVVFKILNEHRREEASLLCVVIGEKGGK